MKSSEIFTNQWRLRLFLAISGEKRVETINRQPKTTKQLTSYLCRMFPREGSNIEYLVNKSMLFLRPE